MTTYRTPATPLPWRQAVVWPMKLDDIPYAIHAANAFPHLVAALERCDPFGYKAQEIVAEALAIARGEVAPP